MLSLMVVPGWFFSGSVGWRVAPLLAPEWQCILCFLYFSRLSLRPAIF